jgi:hypothetical protein
MIVIDYDKENITTPSFQREAAMAAFAKSWRRSA